MLLFIKLLFILQLFLLIYQDFKDREVTAVLFLPLALTGGYIHFTTQYITSYLISLILNFSVLLMLILVLKAYASFVLKKKLSDTIGLGDILFFCVFAVSFPTYSFLTLFCCSFIFSLVMYLAFNSKFKKKHVPLAGFQALFLGLVLSSNMLFNFTNLYNI